MKGRIVFNKLLKGGYKLIKLRNNKKTPVASLEGGWEYVDEIIDARNNYGIVASSDLVIIDIDCKNNINGVEIFNKLQEEAGKDLTNRDNMIVKTPSGGYHIYYKYPSNCEIEIKNSVSKLGQNIDIRAGNGYCVAPGSSIDNEYYELINYVEFDKLSELPEFIVNKLVLIDKEVKSYRQHYSECISNIQVGNRFDSLQNLAIEMRKAGFDKDYCIENTKHIANLTGFDLKELESLINNVYNKLTSKYIADDKSVYSYIYDNAIKDKIIIKNKDEYYVNNGLYYIRNTNRNLIFKIVENEFKYLKASHFNMFSIDKNNTNFFNKFNNVDYSLKIESAIIKAYCSDSVKLDDNDDLLPCKNTIIDLNNLKQTTTDKILTKYIDCDYDPIERCDNFEKFISDICEGDLNKIKTLQKFSGYCLTADQRYQKLLYLYGTGRNGKSTFVNIISNILGSHFNVGTYSNIFYKNKNTSTYGQELAILKDKRLCVVSEVDNGSLLNTSIIKKITGSDLLNGREVYERASDGFILGCKLIFTSNNTFKSNDDSEGFRSRFLVVKFNKKFERTNVNLLDELLKERVGILNWMIAGLKLLREEGFCEDLYEGEEFLENSISSDNNVISKFDEFLFNNYEADINGRIVSNDIIKEFNGEITLSSIEKTNFYREVCDSLNITRAYKLTSQKKYFLFRKIK